MFPRGAVLFFTVTFGKGGNVGNITFDGAFDGSWMPWARTVVFDAVFTEGAVGEAIVGDGVIGNGAGDGTVMHVFDGAEV